MNICLNAREALPNGGYIKISTKYTKLKEDNQNTFVLTAKSGTYFNISISDNGFGINEKNMQKIFDPFFTTKKGTKGSGLGLSMVYGVLKNHNGALDVKSIDGQGTTFELYFPINKEKKKTIKTNVPKDSASTDIINKLKGKGTILIVDDEKVHIDLLETVLSDSGYETISASDGIEAIEKFLDNKDNIDLIILDMSMPRMSGEKTFEQLRKISPTIKVLVDSGYSLDEKIRTILKHDRTDFIQKPFKPRLLLLKIKGMLENKKL
jgi:CheY-like chemotaxis protein